MILHENTREFESNIDATPTTFRIKTTGKAFKILTSNLYKNKIKAIIRELSCNAIDAHVIANNSEPFIVHLPNSLEPFFSVKDFGTGLSDDDVMNLYTTFFESNKTNSNDLIGALGLGSKTPFSYTDSFNVVSHFKGKKSNYTCFLSASHEPQIMRLSSEETKEADGLEVSFNVSQSDFYSFKEEAKSVFMYFEKKPIVVGVNLDIPKITSSSDMKGGNWVYSASIGTTLIQGNIAYPLTDYDVKSAEVFQKNNKATFIINNNFLITVPIGTFEVTPSREEISMTAPALKSIVKICEKVFDEFKNQFIGKITSTHFDTDYEKICFGLELIRTLHWNARDPFFEEFKTLVPNYKFDSNFSHFRLVVKKSEHEEKTIYYVATEKCTKKSTRHKADISYHDKGIEVPIYGLHYIYLDEKSSLCSKKMKQYAADKGSRVNILAFTDEAYMKIFLSLIGNPPVTYCSSIVLKDTTGNVVKYARATTQPAIKYTYFYNDKKNIWDFGSENAEVNLSQLDDIKYYLTNATENIKDFVCSFLDELKIIPQTEELVIYHFTKNTILNSKKFQKATHLQEFQEYMKKYVEKEIKNRPDYFEALCFKKSYRSDLVPYNDEIITLQKKLDTKGKGYATIEAYKALWEDFKKNEEIIDKKNRVLDSLRNMFYIDIPFSAINLKKKYNIKLLKDCYPMLSYLSPWEINNANKELVDYINFVDQHSI